MIDIDLTIEHADWGDETRLLPLVEKPVTATLVHLGFGDSTSELSLVFTDDATIRKINAEWRNKDKATNVLSFPAFPLKAGEKPGPMLGDIILAYETVAREALEEAKPFDNHLTHLVVHGLLHLLGYDHETDTEADEMEALERVILDKLAIPDPYSVTMHNRA